MLLLRRSRYAAASARGGRVPGPRGGGAKRDRRTPFVSAMVRNRTPRCGCHGARARCSAPRITCHRCACFNMQDRSCDRSVESFLERRRGVACVRRARPRAGPRASTGNVPRARRATRRQRRRHRAARPQRGRRMGRVGVALKASAPPRANPAGRSWSASRPRAARGGPPHQRVLRARRGRGRARVPHATNLTAWRSAAAARRPGLRPSQGPARDDRRPRSPRRERAQTLSGAAIGRGIIRRD